MSINELCLCTIIALIVFGPKQLPMLARHLGIMIKKINQLKDKSAIFFDNELKNQQLADNIQKAREAEANNKTID